MSSSGWFSSLKYWRQHEAYAAFDRYRDSPDNEEYYKEAVELAIPLIRVVHSTGKVTITNDGDEDDFIAHAAYTISKAIPKMAKKPREKLDDDKKFMRYLFTCIVNAFFREYDVLHGKQNKLVRKIEEQHNKNPDKKNPEAPGQSISALEARMTLRRIPPALVEIAMDWVRFEGRDRKVCQYILNQRVNGREVAKSVLQLMGCRNRQFFVEYCDSLLFQAFILLRRNKALLSSLETGGLEFQVDEIIAVDYYEGAWE